MEQPAAMSYRGDVARGERWVWRDRGPGRCPREQRGLEVARMSCIPRAIPDHEAHPAQNVFIHVEAPDTA